MINAEPSWTNASSIAPVVSQTFAGIGPENPARAAEMPVGSCIRAATPRATATAEPIAIGTNTVERLAAVDVSVVLGAGAGSTAGGYVGAWWWPAG